MPLRQKEEVMGFLAQIITEVAGEMAGLYTANKLGWFGKAIGSVVKNASIHKFVGDKIEVLLGNSTDEAKKKAEDEIIFDAGTFGLDADDIAEIDDFTAKLRLRDPEKAESFVLYVSKGINFFARERKGSKNSAKENADPGAEEIYKDFTKGLEWAKNFFNELLKRVTFEEKVTFLQGKNAFSLISVKKNPSEIPKTLRKITKSACTSIKEAGINIASNQGTNFANHTQQAAAFEQRAKTRLEAALKKRRLR